MSIWDTVAAPIIAIINKVVPDKAAAAAAVAQLQQLQVQGALEDELLQLQSVTVNQTEIDKVEAGNSSFWVSGARPFIMWGCGFAFLYSAIFEPLMRFVAQVIFHYTGGFPVIDSTITMQVLFGMLGMGAQHMYENVTNSNNKTAAAKK
jgi:hypothetical protein